MTQRVNVVVPVYADWKSLRRCISSLTKNYREKTWVDVYFVNDSGPEADRLERRITSAIKDVSNFYYKRNKTNLGFVKNCNNAVFKLVKDKKADVLLLNSDTIVTDGFLEELQRILYSQSDIGVVNPRSNNATIWSVPMDARYAARPKKSYKLWKELKKQIPEKYISPTAHGFCMLIRREVIDKIGLFDEAYGVGYGEENDFTMRALSNGWKCASANYAYVFHYGSRSFGNKTRDLQGQRNSEILLKRYPEYNNLVRAYMSTTKEPFAVHKNKVLLKSAHLLAKGVEYGHYNGYGNLLKKALVTVNARYNRLPESQSDPKIHIWTHQISYTGAPMVLFNLLRQWKRKGVLDNTSFYVPAGALIDTELAGDLTEEGFEFVEANPITTRFNVDDIVVLNSSAYPEWLYEKTISQFAKNGIKHLFLYIHEDDDEMIGALKKFTSELRELVLNKKATIYAPSQRSSENWKEALGLKDGVHTMPGHITLSEGMFEPKKQGDFKQINFITAGSSEPHKGQLSVEYAFINFYNQYYKRNRNLYREFTLTIAGVKRDAGRYYADFIMNASKGLDDKVLLIHDPNMEQVHRAMAKSNFTVTYSIKDSFSIVTMEGMAYGHPIIRSESSGQAEQLTPENGWGVDTSDWEGLVNTIELVLNKKKTSERKLLKMSTKSQEIAKNNIESDYRIIDDVAMVLGK